jgi:hypothetical protein
MSYPDSFPYDILQASPEDSKRRLQERWSRICQEQPELKQEATLALNALRKLTDRLSIDILLISGVPNLEAVDQLSAALAAPQYLSGSHPALPFWLGLTEVVNDQCRLYAPVNLAEAPVASLEHYDKPGEDALVIYFDR